VAGLEGRFRPEDVQVRPRRIGFRHQRERLGQPRLRLGGVEAERSLASADEEAGCGGL
jgi:hypothetical protein